VSNGDTGSLDDGRGSAFIVTRSRLEAEHHVLVVDLEIQLTGQPSLTKPPKAAIGFVGLEAPVSQQPT
jgi:hypothetical protein